LNQKLSTVLKFIFFLSLGIFLIWLSVHKLTPQDKKDIGGALNRANYTWVILSLFIGLLAHWSRAVRWKMLMEPLGFKPKTSNTFFAVMIGYMANYAIPRLGEVSRCGVLTRYEKVPFSESFGTVVVERIVDVLCFFVVVFIVLLIQFDMLYSYLREHLFSKIAEKYSSGGSSTYIIIGAFICAIALFFLLRKKIFGILGAKVQKFINEFVAGLKAIRKVKSPLLFICHSLFIWFIYYLTFHICFFCLPETTNITVGAGLTVFLIATLTIMLTPGGLGAYPIAVASILSASAISFSVGTAIGWLVWLAQFISILLFGLISLILLPLLNKEPGIENQESTISPHSPLGS